MIRQSSYVFLSEIILVLGQASTIIFLKLMQDQTIAEQIKFVGYYADPCAIPVDSPIVTTLQSSFGQIMGKEPEIEGRQGAADIRHLVTYGNTPTVIFGPGLTEQMHANSEYVLVEDYVNAVRILADTILAWCGTN